MFALFRSFFSLQKQQLTNTFPLATSALANCHSRTWSSLLENHMVAREKWVLVSIKVDSAPWGCHDDAVLQCV